jgi:hypothetical protein
MIQKLKKKRLFIITEYTSGIIYLFFFYLIIYQLLGFSLLWKHLFDNIRLIFNPLVLHSWTNAEMNENLFILNAKKKKKFKDNVLFVIEKNY